jgi:polar amino acid transport system substrate-binding protein
MVSMPRALQTALAALWLLLVLAACGVSIPADPDETLERVRASSLRVGVSPQPPWTEVDSAGRPTGQEVALVADFAAELGAEVRWVVGGEEHLMTSLEHGDLDLVVGGLTKDTPWSDKAALTRPYATGVDATGEPVELVMATRMGENAFLRSL